MASSSHVNRIHGFTTASILINGKMYDNLKLNLLDKLCVDIILGLDFQRTHKTVRFNFGGDNLIWMCAL